MHAPTVVMLLVLAAATAAAGLPPLHAQTARSEDARLERLQAWRTAVGAHGAGRRDRALLDVMTWSEGDLTRVVSDVTQLARFVVRAHARLRQTGHPSTITLGRRTLSMREVHELFGLTEDEARRGDPSRLALRGALLHTDIGTLIEDRDRARPVPSPSSRRGAVLVLDGQQHGVMNRELHWEIGRDLLDLLREDPRAEDVVRRWYIAASAFMQSRSLLSDLDVHVREALRRFPDDADLLFYAGSMQETYASPGIQAAVADIRLPSGEKLAVGGAPVHLHQARQAFERALAANPQLIEARLRLGRTLSMIGRHETAADELRRVLEGPVSSDLEYYAALFLGDVEAALGRTDDAWQAFERAATLHPWAQSPRLGMSRRAHAAGRHDEALTALVEVLAADPHHAARFDPWWTYFLAPKDKADDLVARWRACVDDWE